MAQKTLADGVTKLVHGDAGVTEAKRATAALFGDGDLRALSAQELERALAGACERRVPAREAGTPEASLASLLALSKLAPPRARRTLITGGSLRVNGVKADQPEQVLTGEDVLGGGLVVLRKGQDVRGGAHRRLTRQEEFAAAPVADRSGRGVLRRSTRICPLRPRKSPRYDFDVIPRTGSPAPRSHPIPSSEFVMRRRLRLCCSPCS